MSTRTLLCWVIVASCLTPSLATAEVEWAEVSHAPGDQIPDRAANDGFGGVFISWIQGVETGGSSLYVQRITNEGQPAPGWPVNGRIPTVTDERRAYSWLVPDGEGGVFIGWQRLGPQSGTTFDVYLQRLTGDGQIHHKWPSEGLFVGPVTPKNSSLTVLPDGTGGVFLTWYTRISGFRRLFAQRINADAEIVAGWPLYGVPVCSAAGSQETPKSCPDGQGGLFVAWSDSRSGGYDVYAQHLMSDGTRAPGWPDSGIVVANGPGDQFGNILERWIIPDGAGGFLCSYVTMAAGDRDIYAQRMTGSGSIAPGWPVGGVPVTTLEGDQAEPVIETDDAGGAIIGWRDNSRSTPGTWDQADVFASRIQADGTRAAGWAVNGTAISDTLRYQNELRVVRDGAGGAYFVWHNEVPYGTRVKRLGPSAVICPGWLPNSLGNQLGALQSYESRSPILHPSGDLIVPYESPYSDSTGLDLFAARMRGDGSLAVVSVGPQTTVSSDILVAPHPVGDRANFSITLRGGLPARLELFAIDGRRVWQREVRSLGAGRHTVPFAASASLPAGVYQLRLTEGTARMTRSVVRIR